MDFARFLELARSHGWQGLSLWGVLVFQALLWVGLVQWMEKLQRS